MNTNLFPTLVEKHDDLHLKIEWSDKSTSTLNVLMLRKSCQCALCVDEMTRAPLIKPGDIDESVRPVKVQSLGRYALSILWSDGHSSSIYSWAYLKTLEEH